MFDLSSNTNTLDNIDMMNVNDVPADPGKKKF